MSVIKFHIDPPFAEIILNRPEKRNALSIAMWREIPALIDQAIADPEVKIVILHGGSTGSFAAGADISEFSSIYGTPADAAASGGVIGAALAAVETCSKPVIAAIEGACVGGGVSLAMAADIRIASPEARFGITPAKLGLVYPPIDTRLLLRAVSVSAAKDLLFTGRIIDAVEAININLIDKLSDDNTPVLKFAKSYAEEIASVSQWSVRAIKTMIRGLQSGGADNNAEARDLFLAGFQNEDFQEGYRAFLEKRKARYTFR